MCLAGAVVVSQCQIQKVASFEMIDILVTEFSEFNESFRENSNVSFPKYDSSKELLLYFVSHRVRHFNGLWKSPN